MLTNERKAQRIIFYLAVTMVLLAVLLSTTESATCNNCFTMAAGMAN